MEAAKTLRKFINELGTLHTKKKHAFPNDVEDINGYRADNLID
jgi:hypothetical protein